MSSGVSISSGTQVIRYDCYRLKPWELLIGTAKGIAVSGLLAYTFYRSWRVFLWMVPAGLLGGVYTEQKQRMKRRYQELAVQFKESMMILASSLSAGYSVENALITGAEELAVLYGREGMMTKEFSWMAQQIRMNRPVEPLLEDFAVRSGMEDVRSFAEVFSAAKRSSGDLGTIMRHTAEVIRDKMQVREEIATLTAARRFEQKIMNLIPFFIVFYVDHASPGFFDQMYGTELGRLLMSGCLGLYLVSYGLSKKILAIEI